MAAPSIRSTSSFVATASVTTGSVPLPTGWQPGDVFYIGAVLAAATGTITAPTGYATVVASFHSAASTSASMALFRKVLASGDTAPSVTCTSGRLACIGVAVMGADPGTPEDVAGASDTNSGVTFPSVRAPSVTTVTPNALLLTFHGEYEATVSNSVTFTPDASETEANDQSTAVSGSSNAGLEAAWVVLAAVGASGTKTATASTSSTSHGPMGVAVAVRPLPFVTRMSSMTWMGDPGYRPPPPRARLGARALCAAGILAAATVAQAPAAALPSRPQPVIAHQAPHRAIPVGRGIAAKTTLSAQPPGVPPPQWRQPNAPRPAHRAVWRAVAGPAPAVVTVTAVPPARPRPVTNRPVLPHRAVWRAAAGPAPAAVTAAAVPPSRPAPTVNRPPAPHRALVRGALAKTTLSPQPARVSGPQWRQPFAPRPAHRATWRVIAGPAPPPPPFAVARSAPTVADPRDGTATTAAAVASVLTATAGVTSTSSATGATSTPTVADPRDGTAGVT